MTRSPPQSGVSTGASPKSACINSRSTAASKTGPIEVASARAAGSPFGTRMSTMKSAISASRQTAFRASSANIAQPGTTDPNATPCTT